LASAKQAFYDRRMPPVTVIATLKTINGKPNDPGANPIADIALRTEMTPEMIQLFGGIGSEYDVTFTRRGGEQMSLFEGVGMAAEGVPDEADDDDDGHNMDLSPEELAELTDRIESAGNGTVQEPVAGGRRRR
jgi:hypothetical protein